MNHNLTVFAIFSAESPDTAGEILSIKGADCSSLVGNIVNTEHLGVDNIGGKDQANESSFIEDFKGFQTVVGKVTSYKKIFKKDDCENDLELQAWNSMEVPLLVGTIEFYDGPNATSNQKACAALVRMSPEIMGFSVEGSILERQGNLLASSSIRAMAATVRPCNRAARIISIINDEKQSKPQEASKVETIKKAQDGSEFESISNSGNHVQDSSLSQNLSNALAKLRKTLTASCQNAAPSALTGGAALQKETHLAKLEKQLGNKPPCSELIMKTYPGLTKEEADKVVFALKQRRLKKHEKEFDEIFRKLFK